MAATKSTKKAKASKPSKAKSVASKKAVAKKSTAKKTKKAKPAKKSSAKKTSVAKKTSAKKTSVAKKSVKKSKVKKTSAKKTTSKKTKSSTKNVVASFFADVVKQANKTQKAAQAQTKTWIKDLNAQDKQLGQLHKKLSGAKGKSKSSWDAKISKLQDQMSATRSGLLNAENDADKISTFIEWTSQLHAKPAVSAYLQSKTTSRPTLVKSNFPGQEEYPEEIEEEDDDMNFVFGDDDDDMDESSNRK